MTNGRLKRLSPARLALSVLCCSACLQVVGAEPKPQPKHPYRYSLVDIPVSLQKGTVRTPEFTVPRSTLYLTMVQIEREPFMYGESLDCWMSLEPYRNGSDTCSGDRRLQANWSVYAGAARVASGTSSAEGDGAYTKDNVFKFLGNFGAEKRTTYSVEVTFTKDGSKLAVHNPHLIIVQLGKE